MFFFNFRGSRTFVLTYVHFCISSMGACLFSILVTYSIFTSLGSTFLKYVFVIIRTIRIICIYINKFSRFLSSGIYYFYLINLFTSSFLSVSLHAQAWFQPTLVLKLNQVTVIYLFIVDVACFELSFNIFNNWVEFIQFYLFSYRSWNSVGQYQSFGFFS